jgi:hypothetical protein
MNQNFAYMFLHRLPCKVGVLLTKKPVDNMLALAKKADTFMALHSPQSHDMAATELEAGEDPVAARRAARARASTGNITKVVLSQRRKKISSLLVAHSLQRQSEAV